MDPLYDIMGIVVIIGLMLTFIEISSSFIFFEIDAQMVRFQVVSIAMWAIPVYIENIKLENKDKK